MELNLLGEALDRTAEAVAVVAAEGLAAAMNRFNPGTVPGASGK